ncbi:DUF3667 domain-containing protein [Caulobacter sp. 17J80-11]|uniref:DUF3667 domain-containing protein n=1 Tax=Caulobacter sp. 17J80-11 TaxID=2763502 RepID=UPI0016539195|nr:DUF3667 domain-containing protein [Caulobacter sp. 17J80-11]MBC6981997.1 DUF3667 domain-containing protein [Caulobacter sp. 17J80-11]
MARELELVGAAAAGGWLKWRRKHADIPPGTPCANCETPLQGAYCHTCGQLAEDFHKSIVALFVEAIESLLHLDGRLWKTLPQLAIQPGRLTRAYLDGKRAPQIPPFRLFLVVLLVAFFASHLASGNKEHAESVRTAPVVLDPKDKATPATLSTATRKAVEQDKSLSPAERKAALAKLDKADDRLKATGSADINLFSPKDDKGQAFEHWLESRVDTINKDPERFFLILEIWAHRVAVLMLPMAALFLSLLFVFQRRFFVFDHLVFSMHSLSFQLLLLTTILLLSIPLGPVAWWLVLLAPVHLFLHMRGVYSTGVFGTIGRMAGLAVLTVFGFSGLALLWFYLGVQQMAGH